MLPNIFFISDTHFGHKNILSFRGKDTDYLRNFPSVEEMNNHMYDKWNSVVKPNDKVYHLGDLALQVKNLDLLKGLNGNKILYRGNHDKMQLSEYAKYFKDVRAVDYKGEFNFILSHIPLHPMHFKKGFINVHGHLHDREVMIHNQEYEQTEIDNRYFNVSVERLNYTPIELGELREKIRDRTT